jgi:hypothetical protein
MARDYMRHVGRGSRSSPGSTTRLAKQPRLPRSSLIDGEDEPHARVQAAADIDASRLGERVPYVLPRHRRLQVELLPLGRRVDGCVTPSSFLNTTTSPTLTVIWPGLNSAPFWPTMWREAA